MRVRTLFCLALATSPVHFACADQTLDTSEAKFLIGGTIKVGPLSADFKDSAIRATLARPDEALLDVVCGQEWLGGGGVLTSTTPEDQLSYHASSLSWPAPKARAVAVLSRVSNHERGLRHQDGRVLLDPGDLYGETPVFETTRPCEVRSIAAQEPCRYTGYFVSELELNRVFEGCPDPSDPD